MSDETELKPAEPNPFAGLEAEAAGLEAASLPPDPNAPPPIDHRGEAQQAAELALSVILPMLPDRYAARYGRQEQQRIGEALGAWAEARGVSVGAMLGRWAPELALVVAVVGPALPVIMADAKARRMQTEQQQRPRPAPMQPHGGQP